MISRENPARPSEIVGSVQVSSPAQVDTSVRTADAAHRDWAKVPLADRCSAVEAAVAPLEERLDELAVLLARESGKPRADSRGELGFSMALARWTASTARTALQDEQTDDAQGRLLLRRVPYGVVAAVTPWNAPVVLAMLKVAPALCAGNAVVVKPSPLAPLAVTEVLEAMAAGLPHGLLSVVHGGADTGGALVTHPLVRKVAFTGGEVTGRAIVQAAALTPTVMELGGNDPAVFLPDAVLSDEAMDRLVMASFATSGQVCMAAKRLYVHRSLKDTFLDAYIAAAARVLVTGDPLEPTVSMGPLVTREAADRVRALVAADGTVHQLGSVGGDLGDGYFVTPTLVTGLSDDAPLVAEEQFGPTVPMLLWDDEEEVLARANAGELGLAASVWSDDEEHAFALGAQLEAGFVFVNTHNRTGLALRAPFGGVKGSGYGREYGEEGLREYAQTCVTHAPAAFRAGGVGSGAAAYPQA